MQSSSQPAARVGHGVTVQSEAQAQAQGKGQTQTLSRRKAKRGVRKGIESQVPTDIPLHLKRLYVPDPQCPDCKTGGSVIEDVRGGKLVCSRCGLVIQAQYLSEKSEWRDFADNDRSGPDMNRVGAAQHYLMGDSDNWSTSIGGSTRLDGLQRTTTGSYQNSKLGSALGLIKKMCRKEGLSLPQDVQNFAGELFKQLTELREFRGKGTAAMVATCVYIGAKQCGCGRRLDEVVNAFRVEKVHVRKIHTEIKKQQAMEKITMPTSAKAGVRRESTAEIYAIKLCGELGLPNDISGKAQVVVQNMDKTGVLAGKQPATVSAVAVYLTCIVHKDTSIHRTYAEIAAKAGVAESTIQNAFRRFVYDRAVHLLPKGWGDLVRIQELELYC